MSLQPYPGALGPHAQSASYLADSEQSINVYPQPIESASAPSPWVLLPTPGYRRLLTVPEAPIRANFSENGRHFLISGFAFYEYVVDPITGVATATHVADVANDGLPATICSNGDAGGQLFLTSGDHGYCVDLGTATLTEVLPAGARMGAYLDGYFLALDTTTSTLRVSALLDGMVWDPTQIAQRTAGADRWMAMYVVNRLIYLLGSATSEVWWDAGTSPFPFAPIQEAFSQFGIAATFAGAVDTSLTFLGRNANGRGIVYRMEGYVPKRISTHAVEVAIQHYARIDDAVAGITQQQGRPVFVLTFPEADVTHAFDEGTSLWHKRERWDPVTSTAHAARAMFFASLPTMSVAGDRLAGTLMVIDPESFVEADGTLIQRIRAFPRLAANGARFTVHEFALTMDVGVGLADGQGSDPQAMLQLSNDGGRTWGFERWMSLGKQGTYQTRVRWTRLGQCRQFVPRVVVSDPVPVRICDALIDLTVDRA